MICAYELSHRAAYEILYDVRIELGEKMTRLPLGYFNERNTGELETIMNENVERLEVQRIMEKATFELSVICIVEG